MPPDFYRYRFFPQPSHDTCAQTTPAIPADPLTFARELLDFHPDPLQIPVLQSTTGRGILNCARQSGKSTLVAILALHKALTTPATTVLVVAPFQRQSAEFLDKVQIFAARLGLPIRGDGKNRFSLRLPNRARIIALPKNANGLRGFSAISMLILDEAALLDDIVYTTLRPMLAVSQGDIWMLSTPFGRRGFFYDTWRASEPAASPELAASSYHMYFGIAPSTRPWTRVTIKGSENPRIPTEFLEEELRIMGPKQFDQEYNCTFVDSDDCLFTEEMLLAAIDPNEEAWDL
jgi:hypothetical protein